MISIVPMGYFDSFNGFLAEKDISVLRLNFSSNINNGNISNLTKKEPRMDKITFLALILISKSCNQKVMLNIKAPWRPVKLNIWISSNLNFLRYSVIVFGVKVR